MERLGIFSSSKMLPLKNLFKSLFKMERNYSKWVKYWLYTGVVMIFFQVVIGGITRLTGSGLSITKWDIVMGSIPPLNEAQWNDAFDLYKQTPQYQKINNGISLSQFKFIFFWEFIHRFWARLMGFIFLIPFILFILFKAIDNALLKRLLVVFLLAGVVASFGWIMVASGLVNRPWVNAYKLTMHLSLALILYSYLLWTVFKVVIPYSAKIQVNRGYHVLSNALLTLLSFQIIVGGIVSGMKAGLYFPSWPLMDGAFIPDVILNPGMWNLQNAINYDENPFMPALIQVIHRNTAYLLTILMGWFIYLGIKRHPAHSFRIGQYVLGLVLLAQIILGILTVVNCIGTIPVGLGVLHQSGALILLSVFLRQKYYIKKTL